MEYNYIVKENMSFTATLLFLLDGFSTRDVVYRWSSNVTKKSVQFPEGFSMSQFTLEGYRTFEKNSSYETGLYPSIF